MATIVLTSTSASPQTWVPPKDAPPGTVVQIEAWGAGGGASGGNTSNRSGGAGGGWANTFYTMQPSDVAGITYTLQAGGAGSASANSTAGPDTTVGAAPKNIIPNANCYGAVVGTPGTLPTGWTVNTGGLTMSVVGFGIDTTTGTGLNYIDISFVGTTNTTGFGIAMGTTNNVNAIPASPSLNYITSGYCWVTAGSMANTTAVTFQQNFYTNVNTFVAVNNSYVQNGTPPAFPTALTRYSGVAGATGGTVAMMDPIFLVWTCANPAAINFTIRLAGFQTEQASAVTTFQPTPTSYVLAKGGPATSGTTGGTGANTGLSFGVQQFAGGSGATKAQGGGGGGSAGKAGAGASSTTGTGATADAGSGGAAGVSNTEGGGGATAGTTPGAGGAPGGGGGANTSTGSGSAGGRGQVRLTYTPTSYGPQVKPWRQRHMLIR